MQTQPVNRYIRLTAGCFLFVFGVWGVVYGFQASLGQSLYFRVRHGEDPVAVDELLAVAEQAAQIYPHNFYLPYLAADRTLTAAWRAETAEQGERYLKAAAFWCRKGLQLNPFRAEIQLTKARLLEAEGDPEAAVAHWAVFVETEFWNPDHHAVLAELQLQAGQLEAAAGSLAWARRSLTHRNLTRELDALLHPPTRR